MKYNIGDVLIYEEQRFGCKWIVEIASRRFGLCTGDFLPRYHYNGKLTFLVQGSSERLIVDKTTTTGCWNIGNKNLRPINSREIELGGLINVLSLRDNFPVAL